jgi:uncharacterized protein (TIGR00725 family)
MNGRKVQIGIMGSMSDLKLADGINDIASKLGEEVAKHDAVLLFGYEGDFDSLPTIAAKQASKLGGEVIAFLWGQTKEVEGIRAQKVVTGLNRGGGRETILVSSCDVIVCIGGGSGTLTEIAIAYQANIPIVVIRGTGGWSEKLADNYLDDRKRMKIIGTDSAQEAIRLCFDLVNTKK